VIAPTGTRPAVAEDCKVSNRELIQVAILTRQPFPDVFGKDKDGEQDADADDGTDDFPANQSTHRRQARDQRQQSGDSIFPHPLHATAPKS
jgi:hypothetical protein